MRVFSIKAGKAIAGCVITKVSIEVVENHIVKTVTFPGIYLGSPIGDNDVRTMSFGLTDNQYSQIDSKKSTIVSHGIITSTKYMRPKIQSVKSSMNVNNLESIFVFYEKPGEKTHYTGKFIGIPAFEDDPYNELTSDMYDPFPGKILRHGNVLPDDPLEFRAAKIAVVSNNELIVGHNVDKNGQSRKYYYYVDGQNVCCGETAKAIIDEKN